MSHSTCRRPTNFVRNRFFHDGVRLQTGRVISAISQLRALAHLYEDRLVHRDTARETDHTDHLSEQRRHHRRRSNSSSSRRRRPSEQQQTKRENRRNSNQSSYQMLPATILLAYDSCSTESETSVRYPGGRGDQSNATAAEANGSLARYGGGFQASVQSERPSSSGTGVEERRGGEQEEAGKTEGGQRGVQVRVVEFTSDRGERNQREQSVHRGLGQVGGNTGHHVCMIPTASRMRPTLRESPTVVCSVMLRE